MTQDGIMVILSERAKKMSHDKISKFNEAEEMINNFPKYLLLTMAKIKIVRDPTNVKEQTIIP